MFKRKTQDAVIELLVDSSRGHCLRCRDRIPPCYEYCGYCGNILSTKASFRGAKWCQHSDPSRAGLLIGVDFELGACVICGKTLEWLGG